MSIIKDISLANQGRLKISWAEDYMAVLNAISNEFLEKKPFKGLKLTQSVHLEAKTACLALCLKKGGAEVHATGCNPLSTQDDVCASLSSLGVNVYAIHGCTQKEYEQHLLESLQCKPDLVLDDGGDLTELLHKYPELGVNVRCITEETTTGVHRLIARYNAGELKYPAIAVNDADMKHLFDNRYGTGQSTWDSILHNTNIQVSGKTVVVAGYGWCGRGVAMRAAGLGASVIVTEIDPVKAIEAVNDGFRVMRMIDASSLGDFFVTVTGCKDVITKSHFELMKDGAILANVGHFDVEIDMDYLNSLPSFARRENITGYKLPNQKVVNVIAEGRLANLAASNGHPVEIMDMSFGVQALALEYGSTARLENKVIDVTPHIDAKVSHLKLLSMNTDIDKLTKEQEEYLKAF